MTIFGFCTYCGEWRRYTQDHIVPKCRGGTNHRQNIALVCFTCNNAKGGLDIDTWVSLMPRTSQVRQHIHTFYKYTLNKEVPTPRRFVVSV